MAGRGMRETFFEKKVSRALPKNFVIFIIISEFFEGLETFFQESFHGLPFRYPTLTRFSKAFSHLSDPWREITNTVVH